MKQEAPDSATAVKDPVCGMSVNTATAKHRLEHGGASHYFCCAGCAEKFKADPEKYLSSGSASEFFQSD
jgi:P-type Cu+ transporter